MSTTTSGGSGVQIASYEEYLENARKSAETKKNEALNAAQNDFNAANRNAEAQYRQGAATYGARGEQLAAMGLTGSGYSDYLEGQNFAQMNAAKIAAQSDYSKAKREAEDKYSDTVSSLDYEYANYLESKSKAQGDITLALLDYAKSGTYNKEQLEQVAKSLGYGGSMYLGEASGDGSAAVDSGGVKPEIDTTWKLITDTLDATTRAGSTGIKKEYESKLYNSETGELGFTLSEYDDAKTMGYLGDADVTALKKANYNAAFQSVMRLLGSLGEDDSRSVKNIKETAAANVDKLLADGKIDNQTAMALKSIFDGSSTQVVSSSVKLKRNWVGLNMLAGWKNPENKTRYADGDNFVLAYTDENGAEQKFKVEAAARLSKSYFGNAAVPDQHGAVFGYKGELYMYVEDDHYTSDDKKGSNYRGYVKIGARNNASGYNALWKTVYGNPNAFDLDALKTALKPAS